MAATVDKEKCDGCLNHGTGPFIESCVEECPSEAITMVDYKAKINAETCVDCGVCVDTCPNEAISME